MADRSLTNDAYSVCGSMSIEGWEAAIGGGLAVQGCSCRGCGASWDDAYEPQERVVRGLCNR